MKEGLDYFTDMHLPLIGLMIFVISFIALVYLQQKFYRKDDIAVFERMPLEGDEV